ncbi:hypothetical protein ACFVR1_11360 [Psychrobacillus sp. NPDC058041]|uniref:hypothetical protein n=1 Tax=Psychrobacillus sp. NPDC058041 TaxID=3346310 RepID=UPI0036DA7611
MINWNKIKLEWETTKITLVALADRCDIKLATLKSSKSRETWVRSAHKKDATKTKKVGTISKKDTTNLEEEIPSLDELVEKLGISEKQSLFCIY